MTGGSDAAGSKWLASIVAIPGTLLALIGPAAAFENTMRVIIDVPRQWQCGHGLLFATCGSQACEMLRILARGEAIGIYNMANAAACGRVLEYFAHLPDGGAAVTTVELRGYCVDAPVTGRDRNRILIVHFLVDTAWGELTEDYIDARVEPSAPAADGTYRNTIELQVAPWRLRQCGDRFLAAGGSQTYRRGRLLVVGQDAARFDFALEHDCSRIATVSRDLPDGGKAHVTLEVGPCTLGADLTSRAWDRTSRVHFFVDQIWAEVAEGSK